MKQKFVHVNLYSVANKPTYITIDWNAKACKKMTPEPKRNFKVSLSAKLHLKIIKDLKEQVAFQEQWLSSIVFTESNDSQNKLYTSLACESIMKKYIYT